MATTYAPGVLSKGVVATSEDAGQLTFNPFTFDFANTAYRPTTLVAGDKLQIGLVPKGERLVPHLCRADMLKLDTHVSPTGDYSIGTSATTDALKASTAAETAAATLFGEDWALSTAEVGSDTDDTPIYIVIINDIATVPSTGKIKFWQVTRPARASFD